MLCQNYGLQDRMARTDMAKETNKYAWPGLGIELDLLRTWSIEARLVWSVERGGAGLLVKVACRSRRWRCWTIVGKLEI